MGRKSHTADDRWRRHVQDEIHIAAPPDTVWQVLTDFPRFGEWNPFMRRASGELRPGARLRVRLQLGPGRVTFRPVVTKVEPAAELAWRARMGLPGLFDVDRRFELRSVGAGQTRFFQEETATGLLVPVMFAFGLLERQLRDGYRALNEALKVRAEAQVPVQQRAS